MAFIKIDLGRKRQRDCGQQQTKADIRHRADHAPCASASRGRCEFGCLGGRVAQQAACGQQQNAAQLQSEPRGADGARDLAHEDGEQQKQPKREPPRRRRSSHGGVADRQPKEKQEERCGCEHPLREICRSEKTTHAYLPLYALSASHSEADGLPCLEMRVIAGIYRSVSCSPRAVCRPVPQATACARRCSIFLRRGSMVAASSIFMPVPERLESKL